MGAGCCDLGPTGLNIFRRGGPFSLAELEKGVLGAELCALAPPSRGRRRRTDGELTPSSNSSAIAFRFSALGIGILCASLSGVDIFSRVSRMDRAVAERLTAEAAEAVDEVEAGEEPPDVPGC